YILHITLLLAFWGYGQDTEFKNLQEVLNLAEKRSYTTLLATEQRNLAQTTVLSAYGNALNPRIPVAASITDNAKLPVNFIPAEAFGGPPGTFRQITLGQQYISSLNIAPQFDLVNPGNIARIKSAKINRQLTESNLLLSKKTLFDQVNACYHNILSFDAQIQLLQSNLLVADSIMRIVSNKYTQGLVRKQDLNDAEVNKITILDKIQQATLNLDQQYLSLGVLCDTEGKIKISQSLWAVTADTTTLQAQGDLLVSNSEVQKAYASAEYGASKWQHLPTLSFVSALNWQNNSNRKFFDESQPWINSNYWSLRLSWDFPTQINKLINLKTTQINYQMAKITAAHNTLLNKAQNEQLEKDLLKALAQHKNNISIFKLKQENYEKSMNQFEANILSLDRLLIAHNELIISQINVALSLSNISFTHSKIEINNQIR
ncbi:MAG TPA: TolC family protein, partial [Cytophagales bacterium]|nr:TolC family protein [Cytophagales bacterium]